MLVLDRAGEEEHETGVSAERQESLPSDEKRPGHVGEGREKEVAAAKGVDGEYGRDGEDEVEQAESEGREEALQGVVAGLREDRGRVWG